MFTYCGGGDGVHVLQQGMEVRVTLPPCGVLTLHSPLPSKPSSQPEIFFVNLTLSAPSLTQIWPFHHGPPKDEIEVSVARSVKLQLLI